MARCYQCGTQTHSQHDGSPLCEACSATLNPESRATTLAELNSRLVAAREDYKNAREALREAFEFRRTLASNNPDGHLAMQNANKRVELASMKFREALRNFVAFLASSD